MRFPGYMVVALLLVFQPALRAAEPGEEQEQAWSIVTVMPGETTSSIASRFHVDAHVLREANPNISSRMTAGDRIRVYSRVKEEERFRLVVKAQPGLRLRDLAARYSIDPDEILALNRWTIPPRFKGGERILLYVPRSLWPGKMLDGGVQLQEGPGLFVKRPNNAWGRPSAVRSLEQVGKLVAMLFPGTRMVIGDLSRQRGGRFSPHSSHKEGLDVDIGLFRQDSPYDEQFRNLRGEQLDVQRTWFVISRLLQTGRVKRILLDWNLQKVLYEYALTQGATEEELAQWFQYPRKRWEDIGLMRHWRGHRHHLHVRFQERAGEAVL